MTPHLIGPDGTVTHPDRETLEAAQATHDRLEGYLGDDTDRRLFAAGRKPAGSTEVEVRTGQGRRRITVDRDTFLDLIEAYGRACMQHGIKARASGDELEAARALSLESHRRILDVLFPGWRKSGPAEVDGSLPVAPPVGPGPGDDSATEGKVAESDPEYHRRRV
jgi:hypothetical protein